LINILKGSIVASTLDKPISILTSLVPDYLIKPHIPQRRPGWAPGKPVGLREAAQVGDVVPRNLSTW